jgi:hypothetical protein
MKPGFVILTFSICLLSGNIKIEQQGKEDILPVPVVYDTLNYTIHVQPIFQKNCSPCHFPGGKMYDKLPFDKGTTIIHHEEGILKRIKNDPDISLIKKFISQRKDNRLDR